MKKILLTVFMLFLLLPASAFAYTNNTGNPVTVYYDFGKNYSSGKFEINGSGTLEGWAAYDNNGVRTNSSNTSQSIPYKLTFSPSQNYRFAELKISNGSSITGLKVFATNSATNPIIEFGEPLTTKPPDLIPPPDIPLGLKAQAGDKQVTLTWDKVVNATSYNVYKNNVLVNTLPIYTNSYDVTGLINGTTYSFYVTAIGDRESPKSNTVTAKPLEPEPIVMPAPIGLTANILSSTELDLSWQPVTGSTGYNIYSGGNKINVQPITGLSYRVTGLQSGQSYTYAVTALGQGNESVKSNSITVKMPDVPIPFAVNFVPNKHSIVVQVSGGSAPFTVDWGDGTDTFSASTYTITSLLQDTVYTITVTDSLGEVVTRSVNTGNLESFVPPVMPNPVELFQKMIDSFGTAGTIGIAIIGGAVALGIIVILGLWGWRLSKKWLTTAK